MEEKAVLLNVPFSTADAEYPVIKQKNGDVYVEYSDWQEKVVKLVFRDSVGFKWQMVFDLITGERDDECYEIACSSWVQKNIELGVIRESENYKHFRLNFNEIGQLEVLCLSLEQGT